MISLSDLSTIRDEHMGKKIILTSGTFDLLHVGHLHYLQSIKSYGDIVVVLLSSDKRVKARKGQNRPIIPENNRAEMLSALKIVDYVLLDPGDPHANQPNSIYSKIISKLKPDFYVTDGADPRFIDIMDKSKFIILPRTEEPTSTTAIINYINEQNHLDNKRDKS